MGWALTQTLEALTACFRRYRAFFADTKMLLLG